jgi:hypothetical protein
MAQDRFGQYAESGAAYDPVAEMRRTKSQYSGDEPKYSGPPPAYQWQEPSHRRSTAAGRALHFWYGGGGAPSAGESLGTPIGGGGRRRYQLDIEEPPGEEPGTPEQPEPPGREPTPGPEPQGGPPQGPGGQGQPGSFSTPEDFASATAGGRGGSMSTVASRLPNPGLLGEELFF